MPSQHERNRILSELSTVKNRIGQINSEIGQRRNKIDSLKNDKLEYRDLHRTFSREMARQERKGGSGDGVRTGVINTERVLFNMQNAIDNLYSEIDALYKEKTSLFAKKEGLYAQLQSR
jgi:hypothetical protein